jgi:multiple sugar transport system ATP-binding protein
MNVFRARPSVENGRIALALEGGDGLALTYAASEMPPALRDVLAGRDRIAIGVRPHAIRLAETGIPARVASNQWLGDQTHVAAEVGRNHDGGRRARARRRTDRRACRLLRRS